MAATAHTPPPPPRATLDSSDGSFDGTASHDGALATSTPASSPAAAIASSPTPPTLRTPPAPPLAARIIILWSLFLASCVGAAIVFGHDAAGGIAAGSSGRHHPFRPAYFRGRSSVGSSSGGGGKAEAKGAEGTGRDLSSVFCVECEHASAAGSGPSDGGSDGDGSIHEKKDNRDGGEDRPTTTSASEGREWDNVIAGPMGQVDPVDPEAEAQRDEEGGDSALKPVDTLDPSNPAVIPDDGSAGGDNGNGGNHGSGSNEAPPSPSPPEWGGGHGHDGGAPWGSGPHPPPPPTNNEPGNPDNDPGDPNSGSGLPSLPPPPVDPNDGVPQVHHDDSGGGGSQPSRLVDDMVAPFFLLAAILLILALLYTLLFLCVVRLGTIRIDEDEYPRGRVYFFGTHRHAMTDNNRGEEEGGGGWGWFGGARCVCYVPLCWFYRLYAADPNGGGRAGVGGDGGRASGLKREERREAVTVLLERMSRKVGDDGDGGGSDAAVAGDGGDDDGLPVICPVGTDRTRGMSASTSEDDDEVDVDADDSPSPHGGGGGGGGGGNDNDNDETRFFSSVEEYAEEEDASLVAVAAAAGAVEGEDAPEEDGSNAAAVARAPDASRKKKPVQRPPPQSAPEPPPLANDTAGEGARDGGNGDVDPDSDENNQCSICLDGYEPGDVYVTSPQTCVHRFHRDCILDWLTRRSNTACPCCRRDLITNDDVWDVAQRLRKERRDKRRKERGFLGVRGKVRRWRMTRSSNNGDGGVGRWEQQTVEGETDRPAGVLRLPSLGTTAEDNDGAAGGGGQPGTSGNNSVDAVDARAAAAVASSDGPDFIAENVSSRHSRAPVIDVDGEERDGFRAEDDDVETGRH